MRPPRLAICSLVAIAACAHAAPHAAVTMRPACPSAERWDGKACVERGGGEDLATLVAAAVSSNEHAPELDRAMAAFDRASKHVLDLPSNVTLWEQRGLIEGYLKHPEESRAAFNKMLDRDPDHVLNYGISPQATKRFQEARDDLVARGVTAFELTWSRDVRLGAVVPVTVKTVRDPDHMLARATLYVRRHGEKTWQATDLDLPAAGQHARIYLPGVLGKQTVSLEMYAIASDADGNEVLTWASATRPREMLLRPPTPWYRKWWVWALAGGVVAAGTGVTVYALVWQPSSLIDGGIHVP